MVRAISLAGFRYLNPAYTRAKKFVGRVSALLHARRLRLISQKVRLFSWGARLAS